MKRFVNLFFILALLMQVFMVSGVSPARAAQPAWVDTLSRQAALDFYMNEYLASENVPANWTGDVANCNAGTTSAEFKAAVLRRVNYFRAMAGMPNVSLNDTYNAKAQAAALMMSANDALSHTPPPTWTCYTADGYDGADNSNLSIGRYGPAATVGQMMDSGTGNYFVGHRRLILYPPTQQMGTGDIPPSGGIGPQTRCG